MRLTKRNDLLKHDTTTLNSTIYLHNRDYYHLRPSEPLARVSQGPAKRQRIEREFSENLWPTKRCQQKIGGRLSYCYCFFRLRHCRGSCCFKRTTRSNSSSRSSSSSSSNSNNNSSNGSGGSHIISLERPKRESLCRCCSMINNRSRSVDPSNRTRT